MRRIVTCVLIVSWALVLIVATGCNSDKKETKKTRSTKKTEVSEETSEQTESTADIDVSETVETTNATFSSDTTESSDNGLEDDRKDVLGQIDLLVENREYWQYTEEDSIGLDCYAITNFDCDEYLELLCVTVNPAYRTSMYRLYEVNEDYSGIELRCYPTSTSTPEIDWFYDALVFDVITDSDTGELLVVGADDAYECEITYRDREDGGVDYLLYDMWIGDSSSFGLNCYVMSFNENEVEFKLFGGYRNTEETTGEEICSHFDENHSIITEEEYNSKMTEFMESDGQWPDAGIVKLSYVIEYTNGDAAELSDDDLTDMLIDSVTGYSRSIAG